MRWRGPHRGEETVYQYSDRDDEGICERDSREQGVSERIGICMEPDTGAERK